MEFRRENIRGTWIFGWRPSRWKVLWLLPFCAVLLAAAWSFAGTYAEVREDVRAWQERDRGCVTDPCATQHPVVGFAVTAGGRGSDHERVTYQVAPPSPVTREIGIDLGVVPRRLMDGDGPVHLWLRDGEVRGLVDASGRGWSDFGARPQAIGFHGQLVAWFAGLGLLCLAWVPQQWRWHRADFMTPGLPHLRLATVGLTLSICLMMGLAIARAPLWLSWPGVGLLWAWLLAYAGRAWWQLWRHDPDVDMAEHPRARVRVGEAFSPPPAPPS